MINVAPIDTLLDCCKNHVGGTVREARDDETADVVEERDKLATGLMLVKETGGFCITLDPPMLLKAGVRYKIERDE